MKFKFTNKLLIILFFLLFILITKEAESNFQINLADTVRVTIPDTSGECGDTVIIPVNVDDVTGKEIYSFQMVLTLILRHIFLVLYLRHFLCNICQIHFLYQKRKIMQVL